MEYATEYNSNRATFRATSSRSMHFRLMYDGDVKIILAMHVDDMIVASTSNNCRNL